MELTTDTTLKTFELERKTNRRVKPWLMYAIVTTVTWGIWGAVMEFPAKWGFPETLGYVTWSLTMIPCSLVALMLAGWKLDRDLKSIVLGSVVGLLGAGGQLILFMALKEGPAYIIFPIISLSPVLTIAMSVFLLGETANRMSRIGIGFALVAMVLLAYQPPSATNASSLLWLVLAALVFAMWGLQAYVMKFSNRTMTAESIFFYMTITALLLSPVALLMTDFSQTIHWGFSGPGVSALIQSLNSVGALFLVYAMRHGKAMVVAPMTALAPVITVILSLAIYGVIPNAVVATGMLIASVSIYLLALE